MKNAISTLRFSENTLAPYGHPCLLQNVGGWYWGGGKKSGQKRKRDRGYKAPTAWGL